MATNINDPVYIANLRNLVESGARPDLAPQLASLDAESVQQASTTTQSGTALPQLTPQQPTATAPTTATTGTTAPLPQLTPQQPQEDPIDKFNMALMDMLKQAQGVDGQALFEQQRALQRASVQRSSSVTPEEMRILSPSQQNAIRSGKMAALEPEIDAVSAKMKAQDQRLSNFERMIDTARAIGGDIMANVKPSKEVIEGYKQILLKGGDLSSIPAEVRNAVVASIQPEEWINIDTAKKSTTANKLADNYPFYKYPGSDTVFDASTNKALTYEKYKAAGGVGEPGKGAFPDVKEVGGADTSGEGSTTAQKDYNFAVSQGYTGTFQEWEDRESQYKGDGAPEEKGSTLKDKYVEEPDGRGGYNYFYYDAFGKAKPITREIYFEKTKEEREG